MTEQTGGELQNEASDPPDAHGNALAGPVAVFDPQLDPWQVLQGDCVEVMRTMADGCVDAVVCDPPYGLEFMGKAWDRLGDVGQASHAGPSERKTGDESVFGRVAYSASANVKCQRCGRWKWSQPGNKCDCGPLAVWPNVGAIEGRRMQEWHHAWAVEAFRVLKPGGHLLAFSGTRTVHRLTCAIEDAGFEVRDTIAWMYGSGFPKSRDVAKAIDGQDAPVTQLHTQREFTTWLRASGITAKEINEATSTFMGSHYLTQESQPRIPTAEHWAKIRPLIAAAPASDDQDIPAWVDEMVGFRATSENLANREVIGERVVPDTSRGNTPLPGQGNGLYRTIDVTRPFTEDAARWQGWGTALKPAHEPIVVARKPMAGTVAANVLLHGTGALNIDGCRVAGAAGDGNWAGEGDVDPGYGGRFATAATEADPLGRWPANVVLTHHEDCVPNGTRIEKGHGGYPNGPKGNTFSVGEEADGGRTEAWVGHPDTEVQAWDCVPECPVRILDEQTGELRQGVAVRRAGSDASSEGWGSIGSYPPGTPDVTYGDSGGASRFFKTTESAGRWPANVILQHHDDCVQVGTRRVPGITGGTGKSLGGYHGTTRPAEPVRDFADADGMETVEAWECVEGCPVRILDEQSGDRPGCSSPSDARPESIYRPGQGGQGQGAIYGDSGGASRFYYVAKASTAERNAGLEGFAEQETHRYGAGIGGGEDSRMVGASDRNIHPTVKPIEVMRWLVRLVTPPGGLVLDPFLGSGTTGCAAVLERMRFVGIEREAEYVAISRARIAWWAEHPDGVALTTRLEAERSRVARRDAGQLELFG